MASNENTAIEVLWCLRACNVYVNVMRERERKSEQFSVQTYQGIQHMVEFALRAVVLVFACLPALAVCLLCVCVCMCELYASHWRVFINMKWFAIVTSNRFVGKITSTRARNTHTYIRGHRCAIGMAEHERQAGTQIVITMQLHTPFRRDWNIFNERYTLNIVCVCVRAVCMCQMCGM